MVELTVTRWKRHGRDRLYANLPDGTAVGWADCKTGRITVLLRQYEEAVIATLQRHLVSLEHTPARGPMSPSQASGLLPPLRADDDHAENPPGKVLQERLATESAGLPTRAVGPASPASRCRGLVA
ncbi:hypothetical protein BEK98_01850 [Streptomyces diastatochromogenes]|uniref:Uncharacterized protein n=1 Tax=Streptomyces diastatochromogenes TaxID=42236 RepID=A0A233SWD2_STRDA|nr:hypothetical protein BEK98_01850 [Streptomyces diastatochromogenes]